MSIKVIMEMIFPPKPFNKKAPWDKEAQRKRFHEFHSWSRARRWAYWNIYFPWKRFRDPDYYSPTYGADPMWDFEEGA